jgi:hypothetical protein
MIYQEITKISSSIEKAKELNNSILLFSKSGMVSVKASKLTQILIDMQSYTVEIQAEYIKLLHKKEDLEQKLQNCEQEQLV